MPTPTYVALSTITLTGTDNEIVFSSLPAGYRDLVLVVTPFASGSWPVLRFNSDTNGNYFEVLAYDIGSYANASSTKLFMGVSQIRATTPSTMIAQIMDYSATDKNKAVLMRQSLTFAEFSMSAGRWANNTAINTVSVLLDSGGNFNAGSKFSLYGIA